MSRVPIDQPLSIEIPDENQPLNIEILSTLSPERRKQVLGQRLYNLISVTYPSMAAKITGMLLELDDDTIFYMLQNPEALEAKVDEAVNLLIKHEVKQEIEASRAEMKRE